VAGQQGQNRQSPAEMANGILRASSHDAIRRLECRFAEGVLTIAGTLPSYHEKQLVLATVRKIEGVERFNFLIDVTR